jgi:hypothetical protein
MINAPIVLEKGVNRERLRIFDNTAPASDIEEPFGHFFQLDEEAPDKLPSLWIDNGGIRGSEVLDEHSTPFFPSITVR